MSNGDLPNPLISTEQLDLRQFRSTSTPSIIAIELPTRHCSSRLPSKSKSYSQKNVVPVNFLSKKTINSILTHSNPNPPFSSWSRAIPSISSRQSSPSSITDISLRPLLFRIPQWWTIGQLRHSINLLRLIRSNSRIVKIVPITLDIRSVLPNTSSVPCESCDCRNCDDTSDDTTYDWTSWCWWWCWRWRWCLTCGLQFRLMFRGVTVELVLLGVGEGVGVGVGVGVAVIAFVGTNNLPNQRNCAIQCTKNIHSRPSNW